MIPTTDETWWAPDLGLVKIVQSYEFYDEHVFYSCMTPCGNYYLVTAVSDDDCCNVWMIIKITEERLKELHAGKIDTKSAQCVSYDGEYKLVYELKKSANWDGDTNAIDVFRKYLPEEGDYLND